MRSFIYISLILLLTSCRLSLVPSLTDKPTKAERKLARLLDKHPELIKTDTVFHVDTFITESRAIDTVFSASVDTLTVYRDNVRIRYERLAGDTIMLSAECLPDTIIRHIPVKVQTIVDKGKTGVPWWWWAIGVLILIILIVIGILRYVLKVMT